jgi:peptide/nickel transport system permease protein
MTSESKASLPSTTPKRDDPATIPIWRLTWRKFRKHRIAFISLIIVVLLYLVAAFADFLATGDPKTTHSRLAFLPPQAIRWFDDGSFRPHVLGIIARRDPRTLGKFYELNPDEKIQVHFFSRGFEYRFLGIIPTSIHLMTVEEGTSRDNIYLLGTDRLGRDLWSRLLYGTRISLSIGLVGVAMSLCIGVTLGGISGLYGGWIDAAIQRLIEFLRSIPTIPLWLGLAAALPKDWSVLQVYLAVTMIISLIGWTQIAREVRGKFLALREEDFVVAARLYGCSERRILFRHLLPCISSHVIAVTTLAIPAMIVSETALSFLGLGLRPPAISWGVLLQDAQNVQTVALYSWLMLPGLVVIVAVLAFNFLGDGLRDAADPYSG